jgi:hypothetical protein
MKKISLSLVVCSAFLVMSSAGTARAEFPGHGASQSCSECGTTSHGLFGKHRKAAPAWHGDYYHSQWGRPVALVVPPSAGMQSHYAWGVAQTRRTPINHQFQAEFPGYGVYPGQFRSTPLWPSDTDQFGVYYVRGPW